MIKNQSNINHTKLKIKRYAVGYTFIIPTAILLVLWFYVPVIWSFVLSFQEWDGYLSRRWVMFDNYLQVFRDEVAWRSIYNSVTMATVQTVGAVVLGVIMAVLIYTVPKREGAFYRLIFFIPSMIPTAIIGVLFVFVFNFDIGILNNLLRAMGLESMTKAWLEDTSTVISCINMVNIWKNAGLTMMLTFSALTLIPDSLLEASKIEGAGFLKTVFNVMLPLAKQTIKLSAVYTLTLCFKTYDLVFTLTRGGPANLSKTTPLYMSETAFQYAEYGFASSMGIILTVLVVIIVSIVNKAFRGEYYEL